MSADLSTLLDVHLRPHVVRIDREGYYPRGLLHRLGEAGAFVAPGRHDSLVEAIRANAQVARMCGASGVLVWCQNANAWYLANTDNAGLRARYFDEIGAARRLAAVAPANPVNHFAGLEPLRLHGVPVAGGYEVSGTIPRVSNIASGHALALVFSVGESAVVAYLTADAPGLGIHAGPELAALEGTSTRELRLERVFVPQADLLGIPAEQFLRRVQAGFVLLQLGPGFGLVAGAIDDMRESDQADYDINRHLPDRPDVIANELRVLEERAWTLAADPRNSAASYLRAVFRLRLDTAELVLRAAQSATLHAGARGFVATSASQRRLREAHFFSILTPSVRHLRHVLHRGPSAFSPLPS